MYTKAVFLDKDGTLIENVPYNVDPKKIRLVDGALEGLKKLHAAGYQIVVVTNQSGVALGKFGEEDLRGVEERIRSLMERRRIPLSGFFYCPHHPDGIVKQYAIRCFCRKPSPGLLFQAARELQINLAASWMIGDILNDVEAGHRADCRTILIDNGNETEWKLSPLREPHYKVKNLMEAVDTIIEADAPAPMVEERERLPVKVMRTTSVHTISSATASIIAAAAARAEARVAASQPTSRRRSRGTKVKF